MKLSDEIPLLQNETLPTSLFLAAIPAHYLVDMYKQLEAYYAQYSMYPILRDHGVELDHGEDQQQIACSFSEHGTADDHKSARYYLTDRETGMKSERVYCWKCQKMSTLMGYIIKQGRDHQGLKMSDALVWGERRYGYAVPRDLIRNYDTMAYFSWESAGGANQKMNMLLSAAKQARALLLKGDKTAYIKQLRAHVFCEIPPDLSIGAPPSFTNLEI